jgi:hypothetical protein
MGQVGSRQKPISFGGAPRNLRSAPRTKKPAGTNPQAKNTSSSAQAFTKPALIAFTETQTRFVPPLAVLIRIRWRLGRNLRFVMLVTCVPMPPLFFD